MTILYIAMSLFYNGTRAPAIDNILFILLAAVAGWTFGLRVSFVAGLLCTLLTLFLASMNGGAVGGTDTLGAAAIMFVGLLAGYLHDMNIRAQRELRQRRYLESALRKHEQRFKLLCNRAQLGYQSLNETGYLTEVDQAWLDMLGYTHEEIVGQQFRGFLSPAGQELFRECFSRLMNAGEVRDCAFEMVRKDEARIRVSLDGWIDYDEAGRFLAAHCILTDALERQRVAQALRGERDRAQQYLDIAGVILVALNTDQTIALVNRRGCEILGCREARLVGKNWFDLFVPERIRDEVKQVFESLIAGDFEGDEYYENPVVTQTGEERLIAWHNTILTDASGQITGMLSSGEDITERRQMEENLRQAHDELELRVQERTGELSRANERLQQEIVERKRAEAAEKEQRVLAEALRDTAAALNSTLNFEEVLDQILANLERVVQHPTGNIMLVEEDEVRIVRWRGYDAYASDVVMQSSRLPLSDMAHLRWMAATGRPLIIPDVDQHADWAKLESSGWVRSYAGAPIRSGEQVIGFINLDSAEPDHFKSIHIDGLRAFVDQAAIAIENARLYSQAQELAAVEARSRIAHDLHDAVSQTLWSASLIADGLPAVWESDPNQGQQNLETLRQMTRAALAEMRALLLELRPAALTEVELSELLRQLTQAFMGRTRIPVSLTVEGRRMLPPEVQVTFYRITQEALNNVVRHAAATTVDIDLQIKQGLVELQVCDNGTGFAPDAIAPGHLGIGIMRERAESIGATLRIDSQVGHGTTVEITWKEGEPK